MTNTNSQGKNRGTGVFLRLKWFRKFFRAIASSPDMDLSQFESMENKKTMRQMRGFYEFD